MAATTHQVRQRPPLRALGLAAVLMLVGVVLVLMAEVIDSALALVVIGLIVIGLGLALFGASVWVARTSRVHVVLDEDGYVIKGRDRTEAGAWKDVTRVTRGADRATLHHVDGTRVQLVVARGGEADLDALGEDIARRLDANRGYGA
jgi:hypothetical protein